MISKGLRYVVLGGAFFGAIVLEDVVNGPAENHPWRVGIVLGAVVLIVVVIGVLLSAGTSLIHYAPVAILLGGAGFGWIGGWDARDNYLSPYCEYGAKSQEQLDGCMSHVRSEDIDELDTPAARFARGETNECGPDAGPFCDPEDAPVP